MTSAYNYYYRDEFIDDLDTLVDVSLAASNVSLCNITTGDLVGDGVLVSEVQTINLLGSNITSCNITTGDIIADDIFGDGVIVNAVETINLVGSNLVGSNVVATNLMASPVITASSFIQGLSINASSNLCWGGHSLYEPYPTDSNEWDEVIPFQADMEGMIHASWIYKPQSAKDIFTDLWNIANVGLDLFQTFSDITDWLKTGTGPAAAAAAGAAAGAIAGAAGGVAGSLIGDSLKKLFDPADDDPANDVNVAWSKVKKRPIATNSSYDLGVSGDLIVNKSSQIRSITGFGTDTQGNKTLSGTEATIWDLTSGMIYLKDKATLAPEGIQSDISPFSLKEWRFSSNVISNSNSPVSSIQFSTSNNVIAIAGDVNFNNRINVYDAVCADRYISSSNGEIYYTSSNLKTKYTNSTSSNVLAYQSSYLYQTENKLEFKTQQSQFAYGGVAPQVSRFYCDSNTFYVSSNILMPSTAIIRSYISETIDNPYLEGIMRMTPDTFKFIQLRSSNQTIPLQDLMDEWIYNNTTSNYERIWWSYNSNGMFLNHKGSIYSKNEYFETDPILHTTFCNFPRIDIGLENGLRYGYGLSNYALSANYDVFKVGYKGQISTLNHSNYLMREIVNSNAVLTAPISYGSFALSNDALYMGKLKITNSGGVYMKFYNDYELIISTIKQFKADGQTNPYSKSAFNF
jgi:hypothetical protein